MREARLNALEATLPSRQEAIASREAAALLQEQGLAAREAELAARDAAAVTREEVVALHENELGAERSCLETLEVQANERERAIKDAEDAHNLKVAASKQALEDRERDLQKTADDMAASAIQTARDELHEKLKFQEARFVERKAELEKQIRVLEERLAAARVVIDEERATKESTVCAASKAHAELEDLTKQVA